MVMNNNKPVTHEEVLRIFHNGLGIFSERDDALLFTAQYFYNLGKESERRRE
jgi:hypothetical protein